MKAIAIFIAAVVLGLVYNASSPLGVRDRAPAQAGSPYANETIALNVPSAAPATGLQNETLSAEVIPGGAAAGQAQQLVAWPQVKEIITREGGLLVDARGPEAFAAGHIPGAVSLPFTLLASRIAAFEAVYAKTIPLVVYCADTECPVSQAEASELREQYGYLNVREMPGGYAAWRLAEEPAKP